MGKRKSANSVAKSAALLSLLTIGIKAIGFIKQAIISYYFGTTGQMDSYLVVTDFVSEIGMMFFSSIAITLIAIYDEEKGDKNRKNEFVSNAFTGLVIFSIVLSALVCLFARPILGLLAPGFSADMLQDAVGKLRIIAILLINICISNICIALLNAEKRFVIAKSIGLIQSACIITACIFFEKKLGITALYYGFGAFYLIENIFLLFNVRNIFLYRIENPFKDKRVLRLIRNSIPLFISSSIVQINAMIDKSIASNLEAGNVSGMSYGNFVFSTIHSIIIASITTVLYSYFSDYMAEKNEEAIVQKSTSSLHLMIVILTPICICCCVCSADVIRLIYGRGSFGENAITVTSGAFLGYSVGLLFIAVRDLLLQVLYAYQKTKIAMINGGIGVVVNVAASLILSKFIGVFGIALADSMAYAVLVFISYKSVLRILPEIKNIFSRKDLVTIGVSFMIVLGATILINTLLSGIFFLFRLAISGVVAFGLYYALMIVFKHESIVYIKGVIKRNNQ